jgi:hypothetical protein
VVGVEGRAERPPAEGEVAVEVDAVGVPARTGDGAVGVGLVDQQQRRAARRAGAPQASRHRAPGALGAMDLPHDENQPPRVARADAKSANRLAGDRRSDRREGLGDSLRRAWRGDRGDAESPGCEQRGADPHAFKLARRPFDGS